MERNISMHNSQNVASENKLVEEMNIYEDVHYYDFDQEKPLDLKFKNISSGFKQDFKNEAVLFDND